MGMLGWVMMALAIWHFTIFLPDKFWGGIVGALIGSLAGGIIFGLLVFALKSGSLSIPGAKATDIAVVCYAIPGALLGIGLVYAIGARREAAAAALA
jgi:hypothetical protein